MEVHVKIVDSWGSDEGIIDAARQSTQKGFIGWGEQHDKRCPAAPPKREAYTIPAPYPFRGECNCTPKPGDEKLLRYLYENQHMTPFEMAGAIFEIRAPIFVFREWHRHRTQSYNEMSARYSPLPDENYLPTMDRVMMVQGKSKQSKGTGAELTHESALAWLGMVEKAYDAAQNAYQFGLDVGVPKELARITVPVGRYSQMWASANLRNWMAFLTLRSEKNQGAQWEIRQYAEAVRLQLGELFPRTMALFNEEK